MEICHRDDQHFHNEAVNLYYGTRAQNIQDAIRNGVHPKASNTHCPQNHPYDKENTYWYRGTRYCVTYRRIAQRKRDEAAREGRPDFITVICPECGGEFQKATDGSENRRVYCSDRCRTRVNNRNARERKRNQ